MSARIVVVGSLNQDLVTRVKRLPRPGETIAAHSFAIFHGGKGANQAVAAARLGADVAMIGRVGDDLAGKALRDGLAEAGVAVDAVLETPGSSGTAVITTDDAGENSIVVAGGANHLLTAEDVERFRDRIASAAIVMVQLEVPLASVAYTAQLCGEHGVPLMLDPAPAQPLLAELLRHVTWLTPNESEAAALCGDCGALSEEELAERLLALGPRNVLLKQGARGCSLSGADTAQVHIASYPVAAVDTTAAGDAFNGAFACALAESRTPEAAARFANAAAALSVTRHGARPSMPARREVEQWLRDCDSGG